MKVVIGLGTWTSKILEFLSLSGSTCKRASCRPKCHTRRTWSILAAIASKPGLNLKAMMVTWSSNSFLVASYVMSRTETEQSWLLWIRQSTWSWNWLTLTNTYPVLFEINPCCLGLCARFMRGRKRRHPDMTWVFFVTQDIWDVIWFEVARMVFDSNTKVKSHMVIWLQSSQTQSCPSEQLKVANWFLVAARLQPSLQWCFYNLWTFCWYPWLPGQTEATSKPLQSCGGIPEQKTDWGQGK